MNIKPSSLNRLVACNGSHKLCQMFPRSEQGEHAKEGAKAHELAALYLNGHTDIKADPEMHHQVMKYVQYIRSHNPGCLNIEEPINIYSLNLKGTPDAWFFSPETREITVLDLKYGYKPVKAVDNYQLIAYGIGIYELMAVCEPVRINMVIVQPRLDRIRKYSIDELDMPSYMHTIKSAIDGALSESPNTASGPHCYMCEALHACDTARDAASVGIEVSGKSEITELTGQYLNNELNVLRAASEAIQNRLTALEEQAISYIKQGGTIIGKTLKPGVSRLNWNIPPEQVISLGQLNGVNIAKPPQCITPTQAINAGVPRYMVEMVSERKPGALKLVDDNMDDIVKELLK